MTEKKFNTTTKRQPVITNNQPIGDGRWLDSDGVHRLHRPVWVQAGVRSQRHWNHWNCNHQKLSIMIIIFIKFVQNCHNQTYDHWKGWELRFLFLLLNFWIGLEHFMWRQWGGLCHDEDDEKVNEDDVGCGLRKKRTGKDSKPNVFHRAWHRSRNRLP